MDEYDIIVIGGGPVGENAAQYAIEGTDWTAAIVEQELLGGECSYWACMPSKALLRPIEVAHTAANLQGVSTPTLDRDELLARRDSWVSDYDDAGQAEWAESAGLSVVRGRGRLAGERTVEVTSGSDVQSLRARQAVIVATGSNPNVPPPYRDLQPWGSRDATGVVEVPDRLAIIGGGVVACEAATWMVALGTRVSMIVREERLLTMYDPFASELVAKGLRSAGIEILLSTDVDDVSRDAAEATGQGKIHGGGVTLKLAGQTHEFDEILVATGRRPATDDLGLDSVGLTGDDLLAEHSENLPDWLFSVGDVNNEAPLTHWGKYQARVLGARLTARATGASVPDPPPYVPVPQVVFTDPQVASVGMTQAEAKKADRKVRVLDTPYTSAAGASLLRDDAEGTVQIIVDAESDTLLGATFVGPEVAELVHAATVAIVGQVPISVLRHAVPSFPTASEVWLRLLS